MAIICDAIATRTVLISKSRTGVVKFKYFQDVSVFVIFSIIGLNLLLDLASIFQWT